MTETTAPKSSTPAKSGPHRAYTIVLLAFLVDGLLQTMLAGFGTFDLDGRKLGAAGNDAFSAHELNATVLAVLAIAAIVLAIVAKEGNRAIGLAVLLLVLTSPVQMLLAGLGEDTPFFGALHALVGLLVLGLAGFLHGTAARSSRAPRPAHR
jgi:hypothetical protein